jgi:hypothetical protein
MSTNAVFEHKELKMIKTVILVVVLAGSVLLLSGCGNWGSCGGYGHNGHNSTSTNNQNHTHYQDCGHSGYQG